uniref:Mur ligase family protein n=1 Tax=Anaerosporobacter sp. TaxID=1872529 RepID=UPI00286F60D5
MDEYIRCKGKLFKQCKQGIINQDDSYAMKVLEGHTCEVEFYGLSQNADIYAADIRTYQEKNVLGIQFHANGKLDMPVLLPIPGVFNVYNALTAIALCRHLLVPIDKIAEALNHVYVKGRMEIVKVPDPYLLMIDYAHNALSLKSLLTTLREYEPKRIVCMFGCGGNRSKLRRYEMGEISANMADLTVITSDNPRYEEPMDIISDIQIGVEKGKGRSVMIPDRKQAIRYCMEYAMEGDFVILAGKGHEDYQEIKGVKYPMDERVIIKSILAEKRN